jgi:hypothetical protein
MNSLFLSSTNTDPRMVQGHGGSHFVNGLGHLSPVQGPHTFPGPWKENKKRKHNSETK